MWIKDQWRSQVIIFRQFLRCHTCRLHFVKRMTGCRIHHHPESLYSKKETTFYSSSQTQHVLSPLTHSWIFIYKICISIIQVANHKYRSSNSDVAKSTSFENSSAYNTVPCILWTEWSGAESITISNHCLAKN